MGRPFFPIKFLEFYRNFRKAGHGLASRLLLWFSLGGCLLSVYAFGFYLPNQLYLQLHTLLSYLLGVSAALFLFRLLVISKKGFKTRNWVVSTGLLLLLCFVSIARFQFSHSLSSDYAIFQFFSKPVVAYLSIFLLFLGEFSRAGIAYLRSATNPATLIIVSFLVLILIGSGLLLLPRSTVSGISVVDAFFTSTSAVCVTGLIVVDTATAFTPFGKWIILILIQLGGLGIMTFTTFFGYFFRGNISFKSQLALKDALNDENVSSIFKNVIKIVVFTLAIEGIGVGLIVLSTQHSDAFTPFDSLFHAVSAFCNAGFSTFSNGLTDSRVATSYPLHGSIALLVISGGLGFPVLLNLYTFFKAFIRKYFRKAAGLEFRRIHLAHILSTGTRLVLYTSLILLLSGTVLFAIAEWNGSLNGLPLHGKIMSSLFAAVTPRTAGFNTINYLQLGHAALLLTIALMWIGASPGSTGGGIKTTTLALAFINALSVARGKDRIEFGRVEFPSESVRRAFAVVFISAAVIGMAVLALMVTERDVGFMPILFESVSAFSTVGLTLGLTPQLSFWGKVVVMITMFLGRLGVITLLVGLFRKSPGYLHRYPQENIYIN